jgi:hypothetical protein
VCAGSTTPSVVIVSPLLFDKPWFLKLGENLLLHSSYLPLGVPNRLVIHHAQGLTAPHHQRDQQFSGAVAGEEEKTSARGVLRTHILYFVICFALLYLFYLHCFLYQKPKKLESLVVIISLL